MNWWEQAPLAQSAKATAWWQDAPLAPQKSAEDLLVPQTDNAAQISEIKRRNGVLRETPRGPRFGDALKPIFGGHNPIAETYDAFIDPFIPSPPRTKAEADEQAWQEGRGGIERAKDTAAFVAGVPARIASGGKYGAGDALTQLGFPDVGDMVSQGEQDFALANAPQLSALDAAGSLGAGTMGLNVARVPSHRVGRDFNPSLPALRAEEAARDATAFENLGVRSFGPAFSQGPVASVAKQLSETPFIGAPVRNALEESIAGAARAADNIAGRYGNAVTENQAGRAVQQGIERFKDARSDDIIDRSAGAMTHDQRRAVISAPARETSLKTKLEALYDEAWDHIPPEMQKGRSREADTRFLGGLGNTANILDEIVNRNLGMMNRARAAREGTVERTVAGDEVAPIGRQIEVRGGSIPEAAMPVLGGHLGRILRDIASRRWRGTLQDMREIRSELRRLSSGMPDTEKNTLRKSDVERLKSAITQDMAYMLDRNAEHYAGIQEHGTAASVQRAANLFRRADRFNAVAVKRLENIESLFGATSPEQLYRNIWQASQVKGGNLAKIHTLSRTLRADERGELASGILHQMGLPVASARGLPGEVNFSVNTWLTNWNKITPQAKRALFGTEHAAALDELARVISRLSNVEALANTSRSGTNTLNVSGAIGAAASVASGQTAAALGIAGSGFGAALLLSRPSYTKWAVQYAKLRAAAQSGSRAAIAPLHRQIRILAGMAKAEPALLPIAAQILEENGLSDALPSESMDFIRGGEEGDTLADDLPGVPNGLGNEIGPSSSEAKALIEKRKKEVADRSFLHYDGTQIIPNNWQDFGSMALEGLRRAGEVSLAFGPMGEALNAPLQGVGAAVRYSRLKPSGPTLEQAKARVDRLAKDVQAYRLEQPPAGPAVAPATIDDLLSYGDVLEAALKAKKDSLAGTSPKTSVPSVDGITPRIDRQAAIGVVKNNPYVQAIPGRRGFPSKKEQLRLINKYFDEGGKLDPPGPWGRNIRDDARSAISKAANPPPPASRIGPTHNRPGTPDILNNLKSARAELKQTKEDIQSLQAALSESKDANLLNDLRASLEAAQLKYDRLWESYGRAVSRQPNELGPLPERPPPKIYRKPE